MRPCVVLGVLISAYLASQLAHGLFFVVASLWLLGPGYLAERYLRSRSGPRPLIVRLTLWLALSLALIPLVYLWTTTLGLALRGPALLIATALLALGTVPYGWRDLALARWPSRPTEWMMPLLLVELVLLTAWKRVREIAGLAFPPWVDAVHHALMIRVVAETGRAPFSLQPYLPIDAFAYHWGYHAVAATLLQLTDLSLPALMLWLGQLLAIAYAGVIAGATYTLWQRPRAAVVAGGVASLVSLLPAYYLSWGRYTLLAGLLLVPAVMLASLEMLRDGGWRSLAILTLLLAGLSLIHFVAFCMALLWCAAVWLTQFDGLRQMRRTLRQFVLVGVLTVLLTAPWIVLLIRQTMTVSSASSPLSIAGGDYNSMPPELLWLPGNHMLVISALVAAYLGLRRRSRATLALVLWTLLVLCCANPVWFGLPYLSFFNNRIVVLALFLPASLLLGAGVAMLDDGIGHWLERYIVRAEQLLAVGEESRTERRKPVVERLRPICPLLCTLLVAGGLLWSARYLLPRDLVLNQGLVFAHPADLDAITWAAEHTPPDARFAINTEDWLYDINRGSDGGWWLLPLAGRHVSTPPVIFTYGDAAYVTSVKQLTAELRDAAGASPEQLAAWMDRGHFGYAYATTGGRIFDRDRLRGSPLFQEVYRNAAVSIFRREF
ncbi:MAG: hypothetical protein H0X37_13895 [Herpetosiphonaceae bacterium]|nr:hypothetical protein [Herpetosiphonaceae bacterium]